jgi:hypothetical protein
MKTFIFLLLLIAINAKSQTLIKGITYDMSKSSAKDVINNNEEALTFRIGDIEFGKPGVISQDGLLKIIDYREKRKFGEIRAIGYRDTYDRIARLKDFFLSKDYKLLKESELKLPKVLTYGNALLFEKDSVYLSVIYNCQNVYTYNHEYDYMLEILVTSKLINQEMFAKYFFLEVVKKDDRAESIF